MRKIVQEVAGEGLESLLGERVILLCANYFYAGILAGVNTDDVLLDEASIVYETGPWGQKSWSDSQAVGFPLYVRTQAIEAYGRAGK